MSALLLLIAALALQDGPLERWRTGDEAVRLDALRRASAARDGTSLEAFVDGRPRTWTKPGELIDVVSASRVTSWYGLLLPLLSHDEAAIRARVLEELGRRELRRFSGAVVPLLKDPEVQVGWAAAFALLQMDARDRLPEILPLLESAPARQIVLHVVGRLGSPGDGVRVAPLLEDEDPDVSLSAIETLGRLRAKAFAGKVGRFLGDPEGPRRAAAIHALAAMDARDFADPIAERLSDAQTLVRWEAVRAIGKLQAKAHAAEVVALIEENGAQAPVIEALGTLGLRELAPHVIPFLDFIEPGIRWRAARSLGMMDARSDAKRLAGSLRDEDGYVRYHALCALASMGAAEQSEEMLALLHDEDPELVQALPEETYALLTPAQLKARIPLLADPDPYTRAATLRLFELAGYREALPAIAERVRDGGMDWNLVRAIGRLGGREESGLLKAALDHENAFVRYHAIFAWARIAEDDAPLRKIEESSTGPSRVAASIGLLRRGRRERVAAILDAVLALRADPECGAFEEELLEALEGPLPAGGLRAGKRIESTAELRAFLRGAGLELAEDPSLELRRRIPTGMAAPARRMLDWAYGPGLHPIAEGGKIRILDADHALESWRKRLGER